MSGRRLLIIAGSAFFLVILLRTAWLSDTAYITLRMAENASRGLGLRWNPMERVQATDHPLWLLVLAAAHSLTGEAYFTTLAISIVLSTTAFALTLSIASSDGARVFAAAVLSLSWPFVTYATSGLETPLVFLLLAAFVVTRAIGTDSFDRAPAILAGLAALTHLFALLLVGPALLDAARQADRRRRLRLVALVFGPLLLWTLFAFWYYGTPISNPAVARWYGRGPLAQTIADGFAWLADAARHDPLGAVTIGAAILVASRRDAVDRSLAVGVACYLAALVMTGGDPARGRWSAAAVLASVLVLVRQPAATSARFALPATACAVLLALFAQPLTLSTDAMFGRASASEIAHIVDQWRSGRPHVRTDFNPQAFIDLRYRDYPATGLLRDVRQSAPPMDEEAARGREAWKSARRVEASDRPGFFGYGAGHGVYVIDPTGAGDPLLARMRPDAAGAADLATLGGHVGSEVVRQRLRPVPSGYTASLPDRPNALAEPDARAGYDRLRRLSRGSLADWRRLGTAFSQLAADLRARPVK